MALAIQQSTFYSVGDTSTVHSIAVTLADYCASAVTL